MKNLKQKMYSQNNKLKIKKLLLRVSSPTALGIIFCGLVLSFLLLGQFPAGYADNGNFSQVLSANGLYPLNSSAQTVGLRYGLRQHFNETTPNFFSSQSLFIQAAIGLNKLFFSTHIFDIRFLGLVYFMSYFSAIALLLCALIHHQRGWKNYFLALAVSLVLTDATYSLYLNSFYGEAVTLITLVFTCASFLLMIRPQTKYPHLIAGLFWVNLLLLVTAQVQNFFLLPGLIIICLGLIIGTKNKQKKTWYSIGLVGVLLTSGLVFSSSMRQQQDMLKFTTLTQGILETANDPAKTLANSKIKPQYVLLAGEDYYPIGYTALDPQSKQIKREVIDHLHYPWIIYWYLTHPHRTTTLLNTAAAGLTAPQAGTKEYLQPASKKLSLKLFSLFSTGFAKLYPQKYSFNLLLSIVLLLVYSAGFYNDRKKGLLIGGRKLALVAGMLFNLLFLPLAVIILQGRLNLTSGLLPATLSIQLVILLLLSDGLNNELWGTKEEQKNEK